MDQVCLFSARFQPAPAKWRVSALGSALRDRSGSRLAWRVLSRGPGSHGEVKPCRAWIHCRSRLHAAAERDQPIRRAPTVTIESDHGRSTNLDALRRQNVWLLARARCASTSPTARPRTGRPTAWTATTTATPTPTTPAGDRLRRRCARTRPGLRQPVRGGAALALECRLRGRRSRRPGERRNRRTARLAARLRDAAGLGDGRRGRPAQAIDARRLENALRLLRT